MTDTHGERKANPIKSFLSGGFGGVCTVVTGHPLDTIKVRLQTMPRPAPGKPPMYAGTFDCAAKTVRSEGVRGLYKGMSAPLTGVAPIFALCFAGYALGKRIQQTGDSAKLTYSQVCVAGSFSGLLSTIITAPGERIKCLLQVQHSAKPQDRKYHGMVDCATKLYKEGGIRSLYKGSCATLLRDLPANAAYFLVYEYLQDISKQKRGTSDVSMVSTILAGGCAGIAYWVVGMPADVLKSRLQTDIPGNAAFFFTYEYLIDQAKLRTGKTELNKLSVMIAGGFAGMVFFAVAMPADVLKSILQAAPEGKYPKGVRSVFYELIRYDGPFALYRGLLPVMIRAFPANAACFLGIELANNFFEIIAPNF